MSQAGRLVRARRLGSPDEVLFAVRADNDADAADAVGRAIGPSAKNRVEVVCGLNERALSELGVPRIGPKRIDPA
jgi:hypothetical protein